MDGSDAHGTCWALPRQSLGGTGSGGYPPPLIASTKAERLVSILELENFSILFCCFLLHLRNLWQHNSRGHLWPILPNFWLEFSAFVGGPFLLLPWSQFHQLQTSKKGKKLMLARIGQDYFSQLGRCMKKATKKNYENIRTCPKIMAKKFEFSRFSEDDRLHPCKVEKVP